MSGFIGHLSEDTQPPFVVLDSRNQTISKVTIVPSKKDAFKSRLLDTKDLLYRTETAGLSLASFFPGPRPGFFLTGPAVLTTVEDRLEVLEEGDSPEVFVADG